MWIPSDLGLSSVPGEDVEVRLPEFFQGHVCLTLLLAWILGGVGG